MTTVGILGAGQLGRMLALAGYPLGLHTHLYDPTPDACASELAPQTVADYADTDALARFAASVDVVTYEFENVPVAATRALAAQVPVYPPPAALEVAQDRWHEKTAFQTHGIPTPRFAPVNTRAELDSALAVTGLPAVLKTRRLGYDGKGQAVLHTAADVDAAWASLSGQPLICEERIAFTRELALLAVRARDGATAFYPLVETQHRGGILRRAQAPVAAEPALQALAEGYATRLLHALDYVGVLTLELFQQGETLLANEIAPRVHNSGHWTIEGTPCSQFENHLRAVLGLPLGATHALGTSILLNLIGALPDPAAVLAVPGAHLHLYSKAARPGRKVGHITVCGADAVEAEARAARASAVLVPET